MSVPIAIVLPSKIKDEENDNKKNIPLVVKNDCICGDKYYNVYMFGMPRFMYIVTELVQTACAAFREPGKTTETQIQYRVDKEMLIHRMIVYKSNLEQLHRMVREARLLLIIIIIIIL